MSLRYLALLLVGLPLLCAAAADDPIRVGSKRFTESYILGEVIKQTLESKGAAKVEHRQGLGNTAIVFEALKAGSIDLYADYSGTINNEILHSEQALTLAQMNQRLAPLGLAVGVPLGFNNTYALAMREAQAQQFGITTLTDLARSPQVATLRFGLTQEFLGRRDGWPGLRARYAIPLATPQGLDHGLAYEAIAARQIDVMDIYSTDAKVERFGLRILVDDLGYFPQYDALILYRREIDDKYPGSIAALQSLTGTIDAARMRRMNARTELDGLGFADAAREFVAGVPSSVQAAQSLAGAAPSARARPGFLAILFGEDFWRLTRQHLTLVMVSLLLATAVGVPLGVMAAKVGAAAQPILGISGLIQTIPSLALLAVLIPLLGQIGTLPALVALFLYALLPIVRNTHIGLTAIAPALRESALALGLSAQARLRLIELPLAMPTILAGIKTSAVIAVGTATIAALVGAGGYGERIISGLALNDHRMLLAGALPAAALAVIAQVIFELAERWLVAGGRRVV